MTRIRQIRKRDGRTVPFEREKIADAIFRAARSVGGEDRFLAEELAGLVVMHLERREGRGLPSIEEVQDLVEKVLIETGHARTAKAYILYRHRRAAARAARTGALGGAVPLVGGDGAGPDAGAFAKPVLVEALIGTDGLSRPEAEDVARSVEERVLASPVQRLPSDLLASLVKTELLARGRVSRFGTSPRAGVDRERVRAWLLGGPEARRALDPQAFAEGLGEAVLEAYALEEVLPESAAEAHRTGDLHAFDLGAPLRLAAAALPLPALLARHLHGDLVGRPGGPRLLASAFGRILEAYRPYVARGLTLEHVNVHLAPFLGHLEGEDLAEEIRQWLLAPGMLAFPARGGLLELELTLDAEVPAELSRREPPPPAPPGRPYGAYGEIAREIARVLVRESLALRRRGQVRGPRLTLVLPRGGARDASARALLREALRSAGETGEPLVVFEDPDAPARGGRWLRRRATEAMDPLAFADGDVSVATLTALNLVAAALRTRERSADAFLAEVERLAVLALDVAVARRDLLARAGENPGRQLYAVHRGPVPLLDLDLALHLVAPVGVEHAARVLDPQGEVALLGERALACLREVLAREGPARGLVAAPAPAPGGEAARRFARLDAERFGEAAAWWRGEEATYALADPSPGETRREPVGPFLGTRTFHRVRHRVPVEDLPPVDDLLAAVEGGRGDASCVEYAVEPWPRRRLLREEDGVA